MACQFESDPAHCKRDRSKMRPVSFFVWFQECVRSVAGIMDQRIIAYKDVKHEKYDSEQKKSRVKVESEQIL